MKTKFLLIYFFLIPILTFSQKYDYVWQMGYFYREGVAFELNFNNKQFKLNIVDRSYSLSGQGTSISNSETGKLLFASNGCNIYNVNNEVMDNGANLNPSVITDIACGKIGNIPIQSTIALPLPNDNNRFFYLFHQNADYFKLPNLSYDKILTNKLYYSLIDMQENGGKGRVIKKNIELLSDTLDSGVYAVKHANGKDWWLLQGEYANKKYYTFRLSSKGIDTLPQQNVGIKDLKDYCQGGMQSCFSPDGTIFSTFSECDGLFIYDFDRNTGLLKDKLFLPQSSFNINQQLISGGGVAISPNSRFLYAFAAYEVFQFDLQANDIEKSKTLVATRDDFPYPWPVNLSFGQLAPDCRIYIFSLSGVQAFGYIKYPDRKGLSCELIQHGILLPKNDLAVRGHPHYPNYRLGVTPTYPCDSTIEFKVATSEVQLPSAQYILYPNPTNTTLNIDYEPTGGETKADVTITDLLGKTVLFQKLDLYANPLSMDVQNLPSGMYHCIFKVKDKLPTAQRFVIIR